MVETEVLIIGAGPAGASAALFLAKKGIPSVILDKAKFPRDKICGDAISGKSLHVLNKLNPQLVHELSRDSHCIGSWGVTFVAPGGESLRIPFRTKREQNLPPGFIATRLHFDNWLFDKLRGERNCMIYEGTEVRQYNRIEDSIIAEAVDGKKFKAKVLIVCDGANSSFAKNVGRLHIEPKHNCFGLRAYYKNVKGLDPENFIELHFLKEFLPGYFWIFPMADGYANVGVGMRADKVKAKKINLKKSFESILENNQAIKERFAGAERVGGIKLHGLPLGSRRRPISGDNYMLCGDAAQLIDPFTGEGIGNAMMSGMIAAEHAEKCLLSKDFSSSFMSQYDKEVYRRLGPELQLSYRLQQMVNFPTLFNFVVRKANSNRLLKETISCMFEELDVRARLKNPLFYIRLLLSKAT